MYRNRIRRRPRAVMGQTDLATMMNTPVLGTQIEVGHLVAFGLGAIIVPMIQYGGRRR